MVTMLTCPYCEHRWFTLMEVADRYGVDRSTARYWRIQGRFPSAVAAGTGRHTVWLVPETDLERFIPPRKPGH